MKGQTMRGTTNAIRKMGEPDGLERVTMDRHYGPSTVIELDGAAFVIGAGSSDRWAIYSTPWGPAIVTRHTGLGYVGVELLDPDHHDTVRAGDVEYVRARSVVFFDHTDTDQIGPRHTEDYADATIIRRTCDGIV